MKSTTKRALFTFLLAGLMFVPTGLFATVNPDMSGLVSGKRDNWLPLLRKIEIKYVDLFLVDDVRHYYIDDVNSPNTTTIWFIGDAQSAYESWGTSSSALSSLGADGFQWATHVWDAEASFGYNVLDQFPEP